MQIPTFTEFKRGPGGALARRLGVPVDECGNWFEFETACGEVPDFPETAERRAQTASSGETVVLAALLYAANLKNLADRISDDGAWQAMGRASGDYRLAVLACIARFDE